MIALLFSCLSTLTFAQEIDSIPSPPADSIPLPHVDRSTFDRIQTEAKFPGGPVAMQKFLSENIDWECIEPTEELYERSRVYIDMIVSKTGEIENLKIARGINDNVDECCLKLMKLMPRWEPARTWNDDPIESRVRFPIILHFQ